MKNGPMAVLLLPYPSLILNKYPFTAGLTERFPVVGWPSPGSNLRPSSDSLQNERVALNTCPRFLPVTVRVLS